MALFIMLNMTQDDPTLRVVKVVSGDCCGFLAQQQIWEKQEGGIKNIAVNKQRNAVDANANPNFKFFDGPRLHS